MFSLIVGFSALLVAGCAAFFSVQGLATLYAGQFLAVCIMAGGLEFGKLVATSYLHRYWSVTSFFLKSYLVIAVLVLMGITSLGIFGFLTSAYQQSYVKVEISDLQKSSLNSKKETIKVEIENLNKRIDVLNNSRLEQEKRLPSMSRISAKPVYEDMERSSKEIQSLQQRNVQLSDELLKVEEESIKITAEDAKSTDIGTLKFISQLFNKDVPTIVKWFTFALIFVFDPLAVALILAYNVTLGKKIKAPNINNSLNDDNTFKEEVDNILRKTIRSKAPTNAKYRG